MARAAAARRRASTRLDSRPLAGICARQDLDDGTRILAERGIRDSVQYAFDHREASAAYVRAHAQEMSPEVCAQHIALYVNEHSLDIGDDGMRAIARLVRAGAANGLSCAGAGSGAGA